MHHTPSMDALMPITQCPRYFRKVTNVSAAVPSAPNQDVQNGVEGFAYDARNSIYYFGFEAGGVVG